MNMHNFEAADSYTTNTNMSRDNPRPLRAACSVMKVIYCADSDAAELDDGEEMIEILMFADHPVFHLAYRRADCSGTLGAEPPALHGGSRADMLIIMIDRIYFEHRSRVALGNMVPKVAEGYAATDPFIRELGNALLRDFRARRIPTCAYLESLAGVIAIHLGAHHCERHVAPSTSIGLPGHKLNRVLAFIGEHIAETIRIRDLANMAHMSLHHFARMFKQATGVPPHLYITMERMKRAKALLRGSELALVDIAAHVGFQTQGHFTAVFHRYAGVTPRIFRLNCFAALQGACESTAIAKRTIPTWLRKDVEEGSTVRA
ncbi:MAG: helix-turn-helix domain protein [Betaproteobacteria bacterium]|jgi:AraC-like DNA-binding protein|nr:helix-turn-helix domain protein [Betaproteobacteria bacterium]